MSTANLTLLIVLVVLALIIGGYVGSVTSRHQRTKKLQEKFGSEYDHTVDELGSQHKAERDLEARLDHVKKLDIRPLSEQEVEHFTSEWQLTQAEFVDEPPVALQKADELIGEVMRARGFPVDDFEQRVADISVIYPDLVTDYRGLHSIALKDQDQKATTEDMRQAMIHGRAIFENLVRQEVEKEQVVL
jgi:hypothetical protein